MATPLPTIAGVYYAHQYGSYEGLTTGNTFAFKVSSPASTPELDAEYAQFLANTMPFRWNTTVGPLYPTNTVGWDCKVYPLGHPTLPPSVGHTTGAGAGGTSVAPVVATLILKHVVNRRGRGSQSHSSFSPLSTESISADGQSLASGVGLTWQENFLNWLAAVQNDFATEFSGVGLQYVQLSRKGAGATYLILDTRYETLLGTERSRTQRP